MKFMEKNTNCTRNFVKIEMINVILCKIFLVIFSSMETISAMLSCQSFWKKNLNTFWFWMCMTTYIVYVYFNIPLIIFYNKSKKHVYVEQCVTVNWWVDQNFQVLFVLARLATYITWFPNVYSATTCI